MAHGNIKHYQLWITIFGCIPFPLTWLTFKLGAPAIVAYYIYVLVYWGLIYVRYYLVHGMTGIPAKMYLGGVVAKTHFVAVLAAICPIILLHIMPETLIRLCSVTLVSIISSISVIYLFGLDQAERSFIQTKVISKIRN
jgi:hypothetical protein